MFIKTIKTPDWEGPRSIGFDVLDKVTGQSGRVFIPKKMTEVIDGELYISDWIIDRKLRQLPADMGAQFMAECLSPVDTIEEPAVPDGGVFPGVIALFDEKVSNGAKYPKLNFELEGNKVKIKRSGNRSKTPGCLFLDDGADFHDRERKYYGKIDREGVFTPGRACFEELVALLSELNDDPTGTLADLNLN